MMRRALLALLLALALAAQGQISRFSTDFTLDKQQFADTISIDYQDGLVLVSVQMGGKSYRFLLDTGATHGAVFADSGMEGLEVVGKTVSHDAIAASDTVTKLRLPPITLGTLGIHGYVATLQPRLAGTHIDGVLGFDLVCKGLSMKIDVKARQLVLTDRRDFFDAEPGVALRYKLNLHVPYITVSPFLKTDETVLFDTGSTLLFALNKQRFDRAAAADRTGLLPRQVEGRSTGRYASGSYGMEERGEVVFLALDSLCLGSFALRDVHALTTQGGSHVGAALLQYGTVAFNPRRSRFLFSPYNGGSACTVANSQRDIVFVAAEGRPTVGLVWEQGEPYRLGFREGDVVLMIDGRAVRSHQQFLRWGFQPGREYRFTVKHSDGSMGEVSWVRFKQPAASAAKP